MSRSPSAVRLAPRLWDESSSAGESDLRVLAARIATPTRRRGSKRIAFGWYGGKFSHLDWLLPQLPECHHYCEPFGGSAAVRLWARSVQKWDGGLDHVATQIGASGADVAWLQELIEPRGVVSITNVGLT